MVWGKNQGGPVGKLWKSLKWSAAAESGVDVVPEFEFVALAELPAEEDDAAVSHRGEVNESAFEILQLHADIVQFRHLFGEIRENYGVLRTGRHAAAALFGAFRRELRLFAKSFQTPARTLDFLQNLAHRWQQRVCFFDSKKLHITVRTACVSGRNSLLRYNRNRVESHPLTQVVLTNQCSSVMRMKSAAALNCSASSSIVVSNTTRRVDW